MKKAILFAAIFVLVLSLSFPAYATDVSVQSRPMLSSSVCPNCTIQMTHGGTLVNAYEYHYQRLNINCPNSDVETGSHLHVLFYDDHIYTCPDCGLSGTMRVFSKERCQISGIYDHSLH